MMLLLCYGCFFFSSRRRHTRWNCDWSSDVCSSDLGAVVGRRDLVGVPVLELLEELLEHLDDRALVVDDQDPLGHARSITRGGGAGRSRARERRGIAGRVCCLHVMYRGRQSIAILIPTRNAT